MRIIVSVGKKEAYNKSIGCEIGKIIGETILISNDIIAIINQSLYINFG